MPETNLYTVTIPPMIRALTSLRGMLDKLAAHAAHKQLSWHPAGMQEDALSCRVASSRISSRLSAKCRLLVTMPRAALRVSRRSKIRSTKTWRRQSRN